MRSIFTADIHMGEYSTGPVIGGISLRIEDIADKLMFMLQYAIRNEIKNVIILGDLFRNKQPTMFCLSMLAGILRSFRDHGIHVYILTGNHDVYRMVGQTHALGVFKAMEIPNIHVFDEPTCISIEGTKCMFFPYMGAPQDARLKEVLRSGAEAEILMLHGSIEGAIVNHQVDYEIHDEDEIKFDTVSKFKAVFAGHLHQCHNMGHVWYPGSVERLTFSDEGTNKFFLDVKIENGVAQVTQVPLKAREMITISYEEIPQVVAGLINIKDAIVRVTGVESEYMKDIYRILKDRGCYHVANVLRKESEQIEVSPITDMKVDMGEFIGKFAEKKKFEGDLPHVSQTIIELLNAQKS